MFDDVLKSFDGANVLVTGGTGMIGRQIVDMTHQAGAHVQSVSLDCIEPNSEIKYITGDLTNLGFCKSITRDMDFVFHLAGIGGSSQVTIKQPASFFVPMIMINTNVIEASRLNRVPNLVYASSIGAYAPAEILKEDEDPNILPMDLYPGLSKRMGEYQIESYRIQYGLKNYSSARVANCFSSDTDVLTPDGIKNIKNIVCGDMIYTLNPENYNIEICKVVKTIEAKTNRIVNISGKAVDWRITPDHNVFVSTNKNKHKLIEIPISFSPRSFTEGKKITWRDGVKHIYYLVKYRFMPKISLVMTAILTLKATRQGSSAMSSGNSRHG